MQATYLLLHFGLALYCVFRVIFWLCGFLCSSIFYIYSFGTYSFSAYSFGTYISCTYSFGTYISCTYVFCRDIVVPNFVFGLSIRIVQGIRIAQTM